MGKENSMDTFVDLPGGKGVAGGIVRDDEGYTIRCVLFTDYHRVCVTDGKRVGIAELGKAEQFDLLKGAQVALVRMVVTPRPLSVLVPYVFTVLRSLQAVKVDVASLEQAAMAVARKSSFSLSSLGHPNLWRYVEHYAQKLEVSIAMTNGLSGESCSSACH
jgi:hypothetical protein